MALLVVLVTVIRLASAADRTAQAPHLTVAPGGPHLRRDFR